MGGDRGEQPGQLGVLAHVGLAEEDAALGVEPGGEQDRGGVEDALAQVGGVVGDRDRVQVDDAEDRRVAAVLALDVLADRADEVAEMLAAGRLDAGEDDRSRVSHRAANPRASFSPPSAARGARFGSPIPKPRDDPAEDHQEAREERAEVEGRGRGVGGGGDDQPRLPPADFAERRGRRAAVPWLRPRRSSAAGPSFAPAARRSGRLQPQPLPAASPAPSRAAPEVGRDHRAEHRDRQQPRHPRDAVVDPRGDPDAAFGDGVEHGRGQRRHRRREPEAEDEHRGQHVGDVGGVGVEPQEEEHPDAGDDRPEGHRQPRPGRRRRAGRSAARGRRGRARSASSRGPPRAASSRPPAGGRGRRRGARRRGRRRRSAWSRWRRRSCGCERARGRASGGVARASQSDEGGEAGDARDQRQPDQRVAPAVGRLLDQGEDRPGRARPPRAASRARRSPRKASGSRYSSTARRVSTRSPRSAGC